MNISFNLVFGRKTKTTDEIVHSDFDYEKFIISAMTTFSSFDENFKMCNSLDEYSNGYHQFMSAFHTFVKHGNQIEALHHLSLFSKFKKVRINGKLGRGTIKTFMNINKIDVSDLLIARRFKFVYIANNVGLLPKLLEFHHGFDSNIVTNVLRDSDLDTVIQNLKNNI